MELLLTLWVYPPPLVTALDLHNSTQLGRVRFLRPPTETLGPFSTTSRACFVKACSLTFRFSVEEPAGTPGPATFMPILAITCASKDCVISKRETKRKLCTSSSTCCYSFRYGQPFQFWVLKLLFTLSHVSKLFYGVCQLVFKVCYS
jgi:hypothetical protein